MTKILLILYLSGLALSGCASAPTPLPEWQSLPLASVEIQRPLDLPARPLAASATETTITFDEQGIRDLESFYLIAQGNQMVGESNAEALEAQSRAYNALLQAGELQRQIAVIRQELLEQERKNHFWDNIFYRGIIVVGVVAAVF